MSSGNQHALVAPRSLSRVEASRLPCFYNCMSVGAIEVGLVQAAMSGVFLTVASWHFSETVSWETSGSSGSGRRSQPSELIPEPKVQELCC